MFKVPAFDKNNIIILLIHLLLSVCLFSSLCYGQAGNSENLTSLVKIVKANEVTTHDLNSGLRTTSADITITNISRKTLYPALHGVVVIYNATGEVTMPDALGGKGIPPYGNYYYDLSRKLPEGALAPHAKVTFRVTFVRLKKVSFSYRILLHRTLSDGTDNDNDGYTIDQGDCNDNDPSMYPGATEVCDGKDNDCDGKSDDNLGTITCGIGVCQHTIENCFNGTPQTCDPMEGSSVEVCDGLDNDCDGTTDEELGATTCGLGVCFHTVENCKNGVPQVCNSMQGAGTEVCDGIDNDCDGAIDDGVIKTFYRDSDGDGFGNPASSVSACSAPSGYAPNNNDCNDDNAAVNPAALDIPGNGIDEDCSGVDSPPQNPPRVSAGDAYEVNEMETLQFNVTADDPDGTAVTLSASPLIRNSSFKSTGGVLASGTFTFTPDYTQQGIYNLTFGAIDPVGNKSHKIVTIKVNNINRPPVLSVEPQSNIKEGALLTLPVTVSDPDNDNLAITAFALPENPEKPLPDNSMFIESTRTFTFTPDFEQAGAYDIIFETSDGQLTSGQQTAHIVIDDVANVPGELVLNVDPVESPTFLSTQRITGSINATGNPPQAPAKSVLITGMSPTTGQQGETLNVTLTGEAAGKYATNFVQGKSYANFNSGITVNSINVTSPTQAVVNIIISADAGEGARSVSVSTGSEVAVSVLAFNVTRGKANVSGMLTDDATGLPIANAVVTIQGTTITATTDANGFFTLLDVPSGQQTLVINAPNYELITMNIEALVGTTVDMGNVKSQSLVFDPSAPPSVSLLSIIGRRFSDTTGNIKLRDAKQLVRDAWLLVGGEDAGVLDEYGNQLNPEVEGAGKLNLKPEGVEGLARKLRKGETTSLQEILHAFSFGMNWNNGAPPDLRQWMELLQEMINEAWEDPTNPDNYFTILLFNRETTLSPSPPTLYPEMRLNALQANLFVSGFLLYALDPSGNESSAIKNKSTLLAFNGDLMPGLLLADADDPVNPGSQGKSMMRNFWKNYFGRLGNFPLGTLASAFGSAVFASTTIMLAGGGLATTIATTTFAFVSGMVADILAQYVVSLQLYMMVPVTPLALKAEVIKGELGKPIVRVTFKRSVSDYRPAEEFFKSIFYVYTLYRYDEPPALYEWMEEIKPTVVNQIISNVPDLPEDMLDLPDVVEDALNRLYRSGMVIDDPNPPEDRVSYYDLTVTRLIGKNEISESDENLGSTADWGLSFWGSVGPTVTTSSIKYSNLVGIGPGVVLAALNPLVTLANGMKQLTSDFSNIVAAYVGDAPALQVDEIEVQAETGDIYYSDLFTKSLLRLRYNEGPGVNPTIEESLFARTNFIDPGQIGLAIDSKGDLYTDNSASDSRFGGRIFKFKQPNGSRDYIGSVSYFSDLLGYARPVSVSRMVCTPDDLYLIIVDEYSDSLRQLMIDEDFREAYPSSRWTSDIFGELGGKPSPVRDLEFNREGKLFVLTDGILYLFSYDTLAFDGLLDLNLEDVFGGEDGRASGMAIDDYGNLYISVSGKYGGYILMYEKKNLATPYIEQVPLIINEIISGRPGDIEISGDGRALIMAEESGRISKYPFGISGFVKDASGGTIFGATVRIRVSLGFFSSALSEEYVTETDVDGFFNVPGVFKPGPPPGAFAAVTIESGLKSETFLTMLGQPNFGAYGQTVREFLLKP